MELADGGDVPCRPLIAKRTTVKYNTAGKKVDSQPTGDEDEGDDYRIEQIEEVDDTDDRSIFFKCPNQLCSAQFRKFNTLEKHKLDGKCFVRKVTGSILNYIQTVYFDYFGVDSKVENLSTAEKRNFKTNLATLTEVKVPDLSRKTSSMIESNDEGNALSARKKATRFDDEQKKFVKGKFIEGIKGKKYQPEQVESMMRKAKTREGTPMFTREKWLKAAQIKALFSRWNLENTQSEVTDQQVETDLQNQNEVLQGQEEEAIYQHMAEVPDLAAQVHPIIVSIHYSCRKCQVNYVTKLYLVYRCVDMTSAL
jgi:hypothetical protein